jgi:hypothetical protein
MAIYTLTAAQLRGVGILNSFDIPSGDGPSVDPDAAAFLTAAGITDPTISSAIDTLVVDLKDYGIWTKMKAIYPFVGGTASTHKWNLKNPLDTDAAFRLVFFGGVTHSSGGIQGNGTNGYADTKLNATGNLSAANQHLSIYSRVNSMGTFRDIGANTGSITFALTLRWSDGNCYGQIGSGFNIFFNPSSLGYYVVSKITALITKTFKNGSLSASANISDVLTNGSVYIMAFNNSGSAQGFSSRQYAFASIGDGLTDIEVDNLTTAVQAFQTTLGRQV